MALNYRNTNPWVDAAGGGTTLLSAVQDSLQKFALLKMQRQADQQKMALEQQYFGLAQRREGREKATMADEIRQRQFTRENETKRQKLLEDRSVQETEEYNYGKAQRPVLTQRAEAESKAKLEHEGAETSEAKARANELNRQGEYYQSRAKNMDSGVTMGSTIKKQLDMLDRQKQSALDRVDTAVASNNMNSDDAKTLREVIERRFAQTATSITSRWGASKMNGAIAQPSSSPAGGGGAPMTATNPRTGQKIMSNDGGATWQLMQ